MIGQLPATATTAEFLRRYDHAAGPTLLIRPGPGRDNAPGFPEPRRGASGLPGSHRVRWCSGATDQGRILAAYHRTRQAQGYASHRWRQSSVWLLAFQQDP